MIKPLKKSTPNSGDSVSTSEFLHRLCPFDCQFVPHKLPPKLTGGSFCSFDGATTFRAKVQQFAGAEVFRQACNYYRPGYDVIRKSIMIDEHFGYGEVAYRKASKREINFLKMEDRTPIADVFEFPEFHVVFSCHFGDGLLPFRNNISDVVVIFGWRMFDRVQTLSEAYKIVHDELYRMGFKIVEYSIRRVDLNITTIDYPIQLFDDAFRYRTYSTRAKRTKTMGGNKTLETFSLGKPGSSVQFRAYDKTQELREYPDQYEAREKASSIFLKLGLDTVSQITRIEFELSAQLLEDFEISTFSELETKLEAVIMYLFRDWLRFTEGNTETHGHKSREKVAKWWLECCELMLAWVDSLGEVQEKQERKSHDVGTGERAQALAKTLVLIAAAELKRTKTPFDPKEFALELAGLLERAELPRWGGALSKRDLLLNYEAQRAKVIREELENLRNSHYEKCELVKVERERKRRFLCPWEFKDSTEKDNEIEVNGDREHAEAEN